MNENPFLQFPKNQLNLKAYQGLFRLMAVLAFLCRSADGLADTEMEDFPSLQVRGILDLRYMHPDGPANWVAGGLGKLSYDDGKSGSNIFNLNQAALRIQTQFNWNWSGSLTAKYSGRQDSPIDISEGILFFKPVSTSAWRFSGRLGAFMPPVSMENSGVGWTSPYTLSSSAINSWVGGNCQCSCRLDG